MTDRPDARRLRDPAATFAQLRAKHDPALRERLIEHYLPLARSVANRYRHTSQSFEDVLQVANLALVKAVDGFDPERGLAFSSYAVPTMIGEIKRHFRDTAWALHVPRALKEQVLLLERRERELSAELGRAPTVDDLARATGLSGEAVLDALQARSAHDAESIEPGRDDDEPGGRAAAIGVDDARLEQVDVRATLASAMSRLSDRERLIIRLRFAEGLTQTQIAQRVGVSQMQISRLLRSALRDLREIVEDV